MKFTARRVLACALLTLAAIPTLAAAGADDTEVTPTATLDGRTIDSADIVANDLSCNLTADDLVCFDSEAQAQAAASITTNGVSTLAGCSPGMTLYNGTSFTGANVTILTQSTWINLGTLGFNNVTSSWKTGCAGGYLADGTGGAGTRIGMAANGQQSSLGTFDNLASSAKRCPC